MHHKKEIEEPISVVILKNKYPLHTKIRFIKINIFKDTNELHMNAEQCNPSISILGLQHCPICHHPNKSKKSIKSGYGV